MRTHARSLAALCALSMPTGIMAVAPAFGAFLIVAFAGEAAQAKTPGKSYCFYGKCHRVKTIAETEALVGTEEVISASHYDSCKRDRYNPCGLTSSGQAFDSEAPNNAASPIYPDGTTLLVRSIKTGASIVLRVNNAGPYWGDRLLDVSRSAAEVLGFAGEGVAKLEVRVLDAPSVEEATYKENRTYDPVPGYIGQFASLDSALTGAVTAYAVAGLASPIAGAQPVVVAQVSGPVGSPSGPTLTREMAAAMLPKEPVQVAALVWPVVHETPKPAIVMASAETAEPVRVRNKTERMVVRNSRSYRQAAAKERASQRAKTVVVASADSHAAEPARIRNKAERYAARNSRSYRLAAAKQRTSQRAKTVVASAEPVSKGPRPITQDGTNDMSMFSRHTYAGVERLAAEDAPKRQRVASNLARSRKRDES